MTKKQLRRLRRMKEVAKQTEEVKPDYTEQDSFWGKNKINPKQYKKSLKQDGLLDDDLAEWKKLFMEDMRAMWASKKVQHG